MSSTFSEPGRFAPWKLKLVRQVIELYKRLRWLSPVAAQRFDGGRSQKWNVDASHFVIDVRRAIGDAIADHSDRKALIRAWAGLVDDDSQVTGAGSTLVSLIAPVFEERELRPEKYFRSRR